VCGESREARVVLVGDAVERLWHCPECGPLRERLSGDAEAYVEAFLERGRPSNQDQHLFKHTTATCAQCLALVPAQVVFRQGRVYLDKTCPTCGPSGALVSEDAGYYVKAYSFARAGSQPLAVARSASRGCPEDCGLCTDHEQHTCLPVVEITDHCDLACPVCMVDNRQTFHLAPEAFARIVDSLVAAEGQLESLALSGGEPTCHPDLLEIIDRADRPEIGRIVLLTNGLRLAQDRQLARALKQRGVYVSLQLDGFTAETYQRLRGRDLLSQKEAALAVLEELAIPTQLIFVAARGVNEDQLGAVVELLLSKPHILSLNVQPLSLMGRGGRRFDADPLDRLTIPGVLRAVEQQSGGKLRADDFFPLPCPHPHCVALTFMLRLEDGDYLPLARFAQVERYGGLLRNSATLPALPEIEQAFKEISYDLLAREDEIPRVGEIRAAMRQALKVMFPERPLDHHEAIRAGERLVKSVFVHHYMDPHNFDLERLRKCCHHYPRPDGLLVPMCSFNHFHRNAPDAREAGSRPGSAGRARTTNPARRPGQESG